MFVDALNYRKTPEAMELANAMRTRRLGLNLSQNDLSKTSGIPLATLKKFEQTGQVSLATFLSLCNALNVGHRLSNLIPPVPPSSLDEVDGKVPRRTRKRASPRRKQV